MIFPSEWKEDDSLQTLSSMMKTFYATPSDYPPMWLPTLKVQTPIRKGIRRFKP